MPPVVIVDGLHVSYGSTEAVKGISLSVEEGEILAVLGPNGAGKTSTIEVLEGFRPRSSGEVVVLGEDPARASSSFREALGVVFQFGEAEPFLTVDELLRFHGKCYRQPASPADVLALVGLKGCGGTRVRRLSGGQKRRVEMALALVGRPKLLFMDEPTTGYDPEARIEAWAMIQSLRATGTTILLTTHYLDEAEALADRVLVLVDGKVVAYGPPASIGSRESGRCQVSFAIPSEERSSRMLEGALLDVHEVELQRGDGRIEIETTDPSTVLRRLLSHIGPDGQLLDLRVTRPSLEDAYLELIQ